MNGAGLPAIRRGLLAPCLLVTTLSLPVSPAASQTPAPVAPRVFPYGVFEDAWHAGSGLGMTAWFDDLGRHNVSDVAFTNGSASYFGGALGEADRRGARVIVAPMVETYQFFNDPAPTLDKARAVARTIVDGVQPQAHPSLLGYNLSDDTTSDRAQHITYLVQAMAELDPAHPAFPTTVGAHEVVLTQSGAPVLFAYTYPDSAARQPCDWHDTEMFGMSHLDALRHWVQLAGSRPVWLVGQTRGSTGQVDPTANVTWLRTPTPAEVRLQHWQALGEGVKGLFWFIYTTQQFWTGLHDNPALYDTVADLARRTTPFSATLLDTRKVADRFSASNNAYISTLRYQDGRSFAVVANPECNVTLTTAITSPLGGTLRNLSTGQTVALGAPITLQPGDGAVFELVTSGRRPRPCRRPRRRPRRRRRRAARRARRRPRRRPRRPPPRPRPPRAAAACSASTTATPRSARVSWPGSTRPSISVGG